MQQEGRDHRMDYLGIGVFIIGIAFAIVSIFLIKALNNLAGVLKV